MTFDYNEITPEQYKIYAQEYINKRYKKKRKVDDIYDWDEGVCINIKDADVLSNPNTKKLCGHSFPDWVHDLGRHIGDKCEYPSNSPNVKGVFIGFQYSMEDYYYIIKTDKGISYCSCVGGINFL